MLDIHDLLYLAGAEMCDVEMDESESREYNLGILNQRIAREDKPLVIGPRICSTSKQFCGGVTWRAANFHPVADHGLSQFNTGRARHQTTANKPACKNVGGSGGDILIPRNLPIWVSLGVSNSSVIHVGISFWSRFTFQALGNQSRLALPLSCLHE